MIDPIAIIGLAFAIGFPFIQWKYPSVPRWATDLGIAVACLVGGVGLSPIVGKYLLTSEHPEVSKTTSEQNVAIPKGIEFHQNITGISIFSPTGYDPSVYTGIALLTRVWSTGKSSPVTGWVLDVLSYNGALATARPSNVTDDAPISGNGSQDNIILHHSDDADVKLGSNPVPEAPLVVQNVFVIKMSRSSVTNLGTLLRLHMYDSKGQDYEDTIHSIE